MQFDLAICGAGPAGTAAALAAVRSGWRVALLERAVFPRHKVCGDCLNPSLWPVLETLGTAKAIRALDHARLERVRFVRENGRRQEIPLPPGTGRAVTRESFDQSMLEAAVEAGACLSAGFPLTNITPQPGGWQLRTAAGSLTARTVIAADGRNSTTCRLLGLAAPHSPGPRGRIAMQCHLPLDSDYQSTVSLELLPYGYCGIAPVDAVRMNLCLVSDATRLAEAKDMMRRRFQLPADQAWHSITPLERADLPPAPLPGCFLAGDAARVVEPFTGEGIYYALRSGQMAAEAAGYYLEGRTDAAAVYTGAHRRLYRHRLWVNRLARFTVTRRPLGNALLALGSHCPGLLHHLTGKIVGGAAS